MRIALLSNPRSGRAKSRAAVKQLARLLDDRGHQVAALDVFEPQEKILDTVGGCDRVVVIGGDGTMHHQLTTLCTLQIPAYHFATGTANIIAKQFRMSNSPARAVANLELDHPPRTVYIPTANGTKFAMMLSLGIDASVIHRFESSRGTSGGYRAYTSPILAEIASPRPARVSIENSAGEVREMGSPGIAIVSNMPAYPMRVNPCHSADPSAPDLVARFIPARTSVHCAFQFGRMRVRRSSKPTSTLKSTKMTLRVLDNDCPVQVDGECASHIQGLEDGFLNPGSQIMFETGEHTMLLHAH